MGRGPSPAALSRAADLLLRKDMKDTLADYWETFDFSDTRDKH